MDAFQTWYVRQAAELSAVFGPDSILIDDSEWRRLLILNYTLPENWQQSESRLLIMFPPAAQALTLPPDRFYLDQGLRTISGGIPKHYFEKAGDYNDLGALTWARYSFHVKGQWRLRVYDEGGSNIVEVLDSLDDALYAAAQEADNE